MQPLAHVMLAQCSLLPPAHASVQLAMFVCPAVYPVINGADANNCAGGPGAEGKAEVVGSA